MACTPNRKKGLKGYLSSTNETKNSGNTAKSNLASYKTSSPFKREIITRAERIEIPPTNGTFPKWELLPPDFATIPSERKIGL
jgi:hypothetical protein